ncbi:MAG: response regulator, partial [Bacteroidales bacterium]|nr:response regulator [Bacteroidales bacterium]
EELQRTIDMALYKHEMENKLRISEEQLRQSQKMQTIGTLAGGIAHDFNNILSPLFGYTEMLLLDVPQGSHIHNDLEQILKAAKRAKDLVHQILTFSRQGESEPQPFQIHFIVNEVLKLLQASLPETIKIIKDVQSDCCIILADATQIHQVIMNLCTNASYAMRKNGGTLEVKLDSVQLDARNVMAFGNLDKGLYASLSVRDTGQGMDKKTIARIFEPFFTTKPVGEGTGLGLSVTHGIVKNHGGAIVVDSEPGKGSTFQVLLPIVQQNVKQPTVNISDIPKGNNEHILLVDNEEDIVKMLRIMLERLGYIVTEKTSSLQALETFRNAPKDFDIVISDQTMPGMMGAQLLKEIISIRSDIPIILCSGFGETINRKMAEKMGIKGYIRKPFSQQDIALTIRQVLDNNY